MTLPGTSETLDALRDAHWISEADVQRRLIEPVLGKVGWSVTAATTEVWIGLSEEMAQLWNYPSRRMRRDYVLSCQGREVLHVEAKHSWSRRQLNIETFLRAINRGDWTSTRQDGVKKDLALLLWGAKERAARRAALIDEERLMVFDWDGGWTLRSEVKLFEDPTDDVEAAFGLLAPKAFGSGGADG